MIDVATDFPYLGDRDYVHGTSILNGVLAALESAAPGRTELKRLKFQRPATTNGRLTLRTAAVSETELADANCTVLAAVNESVWRGFFKEDGTRVKARVPVSYPIADLVANGYGGRCVISPNGRDDLVRTLVEANKRFHQAAFEGPGSPAVRFGYIESWSVPEAAIAFTGRLEAKNLITRRTADGVMTINKLTYSHDAGGAASLSLCFEVHGATGA